MTDSKKLTDDLERKKALASTTLSAVFAGQVVALDERALRRPLAIVGNASVAPKAINLPEGVRVIEVNGPLMQRSFSGWWADYVGYDAIADQFVAAAADPAVQAILLRIDSPGGVVAGCFEAVRRMIAARDASGKPVVAFADELAASAAYAIACVADAGIVGPVSAEVGSVGVLNVHMTEARALDAFGIDVTVFRSGVRKADANSLEPLTDEARKAIQDQVDALAADFHKLVATSRGLDASVVKGWEAAVFSARDAKRVGAADRIGSIEDAASAALKEARKRQGTKNMKIKAALGLSAEATEDEVVEVATQAKIALDNLPKVLSALGAKSLDEAMGAIDGLNKTATSLADAKALAAKLEAEKTEREIDDLVREGRASGKITAAAAADWRQDAVENLERTKAKLGRAPVVIDRVGPLAPTEPEAGAKAWDDLSLDERKKLQKDDPEKFAALLEEHRARKGTKARKPRR